MSLRGEPLESEPWMRSTSAIEERAVAMISEGKPGAAMGAVPRRQRHYAPQVESSHEPAPRPTERLWHSPPTRVFTDREALTPGRSWVNERGRKPAARGNREP